jgi:hypothetical protein
MTISIHYPTGARDQQLQPVSIHVDPSGNCLPPWTGEKKDQDAAPSRREKQRHGSVSSRSSRSSSPSVDRQQKIKSSVSPKGIRRSVMSDAFSEKLGVVGGQLSTDTGPPVIKVQSPKLIESLDDDYDPVRFQKPFIRPAKVSIIYQTAWLLDLISLCQIVPSDVVFAPEKSRTIRRYF